MNLAYLIPCRRSPAQFLWSAIFALFFLCLTAIPANAQTFTADWTNLGVGSIQGVSSGSSVTAGPRTVTITHQQITDGGPFTNFYGTEMLNYFNGTIGTQAGTLLYSMDNDTFDPDDRFQTIYTFSGTVSNLQFSLAHVDSATSPRSDGITIEYRNGLGAWQNIRSTPALYTLGPVVGNATLSGTQGFVGTGSAGGLTSTTGNINVNFNAASVTEVRITYHFGQNQAGNPAGNVQYVGLSDFTFQVPGTLVSDLSLAKSVSNPTPASGTAVNYTLQLTNSASSVADSNVQVQDILPAGFAFTSASGYGSYNSITGIWTVPAIAAGQTRTITIFGTVAAPNGTTITNYAEVISQTNFDTDSTPNNGSGTEDDDATASFTTTGTRSAGTPPTLVCPSGTTLFDWNSPSVVWASGSFNNSYNVTNIGNVNFALSNTGGTWEDGSPVDNSANTSNLATTEQSLYQNLQFTTRFQTAATVITLPTAVPGLQIRVFDVDFNANDFADKLTITGSFNGASVTPILTNGVANYVVGNSAVGDAGSGSTSADGDVYVTFSSPVDTVTLTYGNDAGTAPPDPDGQAISIHDITFCNPVANLSVTKISSVLSDGVSASNPKAIPGAIVQYCILITNAGSGTATLVSASDVIPADLSFITGSMRTGTNCGAASVEDENATGADESDPFGMSLSGTTITGIAASLAPGANMALVFNATVD